MFIKYIYYTVLFSISIYCFPIYAQNNAVAEAYYKIKEYYNAEKYYDTSNLNTEQAIHLADCYFYNQKYQKAYSLYHINILKSNYNNSSIRNYLECLKTLEKLEQLSSILRSPLITDNSLKTFYITNLDSIKSWTKKQSNTSVIPFNIINSPEPEFAPYHYQNKLYFCKPNQNNGFSKISGVNGYKYFDIFYLDSNSNKSYIEIKSLDLINSKDHEGPLCFNKNGTEVYYTRSGDAEETGKKRHLKLYQRVFSNNKWLPEKEFLLNDSNYSFGHPQITADDKIFFFISDIPGGYGGTDIYMSLRIDSIHWSKPINLGPNINTAGNEVFPHFDGDKTLYFSSNGQMTYGGYDLFKATLDNSGEWQKPNNLPIPFNSPYDDLSPSIDPQNKNKLWFSSNRPGGKGKEDIYFIILNEETGH